ncbi:MAG: Holliday junction resolvase RuvX [Rhizobiales bacterium]|nr:Holliday junction resolvase RuvX [Hyphomicrobiales bacterium]
MTPLPVLSDIAHLLQRNDRVMALDLGTKTIGIAISDAERRWASGLRTLVKGKFSVNADEILKIAAHYQVAVIVLGLPLNMDGSSGPRVQATRAFAKNLGSLTDIAIVFEDERLTTVAADDLLAAAHISGKKRAAIIDTAAAQVILQQALDRLAR